jgi:hypothetical protein
MAQRITRKHLDHYVRELNEVAGSPMTYFINPGDPDDRRTNVGHYCIDCSNGGYELHQICNQSGGADNASSGGHISARDLLNQIQCAIKVVRAFKQGAQS